MPRKNKDEYTTISVKKSTKKKFNKFKKLPKETDEKTLMRIIKKEIKEK